MPTLKKLPAVGQANKKAKEFLPDWLVDMFIREDLDPADALNPIAGAVLGPTEKAAQRLLKAHNLPTSFIDRMRRLAEQGYTEPVWHGTTQNIEAFRPGILNQAEDLGIHVASNPATASHAVSMGNTFKPGANVLPLAASLENIAQLPKDVSLFKHPGRWVGALEEAQDPRLRQLAEQAMDLISRSKNTPQGYMHLQDEWQSLIKQFMQENKIGSFAYPNLIEGAGELSYMLMDPRRLKSIYAKTGPTSRRTPNLLK